jgi:hypothetical protein
MVPPSPLTRDTKSTSKRFSIKRSTNSIYETSEDSFFGPYAHIRSQLDYKYHSNYTKERQWLQDSIIDKLLSEIVTRESSSNEADETETEVAVSLDESNSSRKSLSTMPVTPWLIYVAGTGKSNRTFTIKCLFETQSKSQSQSSIGADTDTDTELSRFPILGFVLVDSREIHSLLPEYQCYSIEDGKDIAGDRTRKETGYISEVLTRAALQAGTNVLIYGALRDSGWYKQYFHALSTDFEELKIAVLHIVAPREESEIERQRIAAAIDELKPTINFFCKLQSGPTSEDIKILTDGITWQSFQSKFTQECGRVHRIIRKFPVQHRGELGFIPAFSPHQSTEENYKSTRMNFYGPFAHLRKSLDYKYHRNYIRERQMLQDAIISETLNQAKVKDANSGEFCTTPTEPFLVFTAGAMGAGKSYTLKKIQPSFPLSAFVIVDPDEIRQQFPEYSLYVEQNPLEAGEMTRKEAGYIVEILTLAALQAGKNVLVDGSLRDWEWYALYFKRLRKEYPSLKISILHVTAPKSAIFARAEARGQKTGRVVPRETLEMALEQVPKSVEILRDKVDYYCQLKNAPDVDEIEITTEDITWEDFEQTWKQTCAWIPKAKRGTKTLRVKSTDMGPPPSS